MNYPRVSQFPTSESPALNHGMKLVTADEKKTVIAEFDRAHHFTRRASEAGYSTGWDGYARLHRLDVGFCGEQAQGARKEDKVDRGRLTPHSAIWSVIITIMCGNTMMIMTF